MSCFPVTAVCLLPVVPYISYCCHVCRPGAVQETKKKEEPVVKEEDVVITGEQEAPAGTSKTRAGGKRAAAATAGQGPAAKRTRGAKEVATLEREAAPMHAAKASKPAGE